MATKTEPKKGQPQKPAPADEHYGAFGFFRKHQKLILYTAGLFALVSFSITGALLGMFDTIFQKSTASPTIEVGGKVVHLQQEDYEFARLIAGQGHSPTLVLPIYDPGERDEAIDGLAIMRRAAITEGFNVSDEEVDRAIEFAVRKSEGAQSATQLAMSRGMSSLEAYRQVVKEAMRIGNFMRLQALAANSSDVELVAQLLKNREKIKLTVAQLDVKAIEESLKTDELDDEAMQKYLEEMPDAEKNRFRDTNHVSLQVCALLFEGFDPALWQEGVLADVELGDEQLQQIYNIERERRFKIDPEQYEKDNPDGPFPAPPYRLFEDEDVKGECTKLAQADEVMNHLWGIVREKRNEVLQPLITAFGEARSAESTARLARDEAAAKSEEKPDDAELKTALETAETELTAKTEAATAAEEALQTAREAFDVKAAFLAAVGDKPSFTVFDLQGPHNADGLRELGDLGDWTSPYAATNIGVNGEISSRVDRTEKGAFHFKVTEFVERPLKPFEDIKEDLVDSYVQEQAKEQADEKKKALEDALLRLAKEKMPEKVQELEGQKDTKVQEQLDTWETTLQAKIADAEKQLSEIRAGTAAYEVWEANLATLREELATKEDKRAEYVAGIDEEIEGEIAEEAKKHYSEIFDLATAEAGFEIVEIGPYDRSLRSTPRFYFRYEEPEKFLMGNAAVTALKKDEVTDVLDDMTNRRVYLVRCDEVEPLTLEDLTRRDFTQQRENFPRNRVLNALQQSFTKEALELRYRFKRAEGDEPEAAGPK